jgi:hypothetical protein
VGPFNLILVWFRVPVLDARTDRGAFTYGTMNCGESHIPENIVADGGNGGNGGKCCSRWLCFLLREW